MVIKLEKNIIYKNENEISIWIKYLYRKYFWNNNKRNLFKIKIIYIYLKK